MSTTKPPTEVLLTFYCRTGAAERLALAAAVGAVQARAAIRLRRMADVAPAPAEGGPDLARMCREYIAASEADVVRADAIILVAPAGFTASAPEWADYLQLLKRLGSDGKLESKIATVLGETEVARTALADSVLQLGFRTVLAASADPMTQGRFVAAAAQALKLGEFRR